jgi:predicted dehydrogenase
MRVLLIGARRVRTGTGPYLARFLAEAGLPVTAVLGTTAESATAAAEALAAPGRPQPAAYSDAYTAFDKARPEVVVICSPTASHQDLLARALDASAHVLCEKPLLWAGWGSGDRADTLAKAFELRERHLVVHAQWPYVLPTWRTLTGAREGWQPKRFRMHLEPSSIGPHMILDALPHPLSVLATLLPGSGASIENLRMDCPGGDPESLDVRFTYRMGIDAIDARIDLRSSKQTPRPAAIGFDGRLAWREIEEPGYQLFLRHAERRIPLPDPARLLVGSFVSLVRAGEPPVPDAAVTPGVRHLEQLMRAYEDQIGPLSEELS